MSLNVVLVVMDPQPNALPGPWPWEVRVGEGWWLSWNQDSARFDFHEGTGGGGDLNPSEDKILKVRPVL